MYVPLLERQEALELVAAEAGRARAGTGRLVLLRGATGTGRTALLEAAAERAARAGMRVLRARCSPDDTGLPFAAVRQLLGAETECADTPGAPRAAEGPEVSVMPAMPVMPGVLDERARGAWLWRLLRSFAAGPPLFVAVDDVHLADGPSRRWLVDVVRRVDRLPLLLVVTERGQYDVDAPSAGLAHGLSPALVRTLTLAPLGPDSTTELVRSDFGAVPQAWGEDCVRASAGNPLLLRALLDDLRGTLPATVPKVSAALYPGAYQAAVSWWLDNAGPATAEVARALATLEDDAAARPARTPSGTPNGRSGVTPAAPDGGPGFAPDRDTGFAPDGGPGFASGDGSGFASDGGAGFAPGGGAGFAPGGGAGFASDSGSGFASDGGAGFAPDGGPGFALEGDVGFPPGRGPGFAPGGDADFAPDRANGCPPDGGTSLQPGRGAGLPPDRDAGFPPEGRVGGTSLHPDRREDAPDRREAAPGQREPAPTRREPTPGRWEATPDRREGVPDRQGAAPNRREAVRPGVPPSRPGSDAGHEGDAGAQGRAVPGDDPVSGDPVSGGPVSDHPVSGEFAELVGGVAGADPVRVAGWLTAMTRLGFLRTGADGRPRYAHPLLRDAVMSGWPVTRRRAAHRTAAGLMLRRGDPAEAVAARLLRTDPVGEEWATDVLLDAAALTLHAGRTDDALPYLRRALDEPLADDHRQRLLTELGSLEYATVRSSAGIPRLAEAVRLPGVPQNRVRAAVALGTALAGRGEARAAVDVLRSLDPQLTDHPGLARTVRIASVLLADHDQETRQEAYRRLRETAVRSPGLVGPAGQALLVRHEATAGLISADAAMERVRALLAEPVDPLAEPYLLGTAAAVAQWADELEEAERLVERGLARQRPSLLHPMHRALLNVRADIAAARGVYARLLSGPDARRSAGTRPSPANGQAHAVLALVETGRMPEAGRLAGAFDLREAPDSWELNRFLYARGVLRAAAGDPAGALDDFLECGRRQSAREVVSPVVTPWRTAAAECRLTLGRPREALELAEEELRLAQVWDTPRTVGRALRVLGTATGGRRGLDLADRAVQVLRDASVETELIPALIAQGRQLTAAGERARARDCLREAAERAERLGAVRLRAAAEDALREGGGRRTTTALTGSDALTGSERRIAELAADGRTNTEIAELLHLARRTVETHLTSTYRKLGIRSRADLPAALGRRQRDG